MVTTIRMEGIYAASDDIVAREIEGELIIVPLVAGIGDLEDELYTLNGTGKAIWKQLNDHTSLREVVESLQGNFDAPPGEIERDVLGLVEELVRRRMLVEVTPD